METLISNSTNPMRQLFLDDVIVLLVVTTVFESFDQVVKSAPTRSFICGQIWMVWLTGKVGLVPARGISFELLFEVLVVLCCVREPQYVQLTQLLKICPRSLWHKHITFVELGSRAH